MVYSDLCSGCGDSFNAISQENGTGKKRWPPSSGERREAILASLRERDLLSSDLQAALDGAGTLAELEDLYLPYRPKRRTRAMIAREKGLEPFADLLLGVFLTNPDTRALAYWPLVLWAVVIGLDTSGMVVV